MSLIINIVFIIALCALLGWIFLKYSKLAQERNKSIALYGLLGICSLLLGTYLGGLIEIAAFGNKQGLLAALLGFGFCFFVYRILRNL